MWEFNSVIIPCMLMLLLTLVNCDLHHIIESPKITNWGSWGELESCPVGHFVTGMQLKVETSDGWKDDTGLNGIRLFCSRLGKSVDIYEESPTVISSSVGPYGEWKDIFRCSDKDLDPKTSAVVGFQMKIEHPKGVKDDTSANNFRVFCENLGDETEQSEEDVPQHLVLEGDGTTWGHWTDSQLCRKGYAICGIVTQVDHGHAEGTGYDDTALNNVRAECCKIRFHDDDSQEQEKKDNVMFPDPMESARDLEKSIHQMKHSTNQETPVPMTEDMSSEVDTVRTITLPEVLGMDASTKKSVSDSETELSSSISKSDKSDKLSEELSRLANLDFGHPEISTQLKIVSDPAEVSSTLAHGVHTIDEISAKPIVPPEVVQYIESDLKDEDADPDPIHIKIIAGAVDQSTPFTPTNDGGREDNDVHNQLLISSNSNYFYPTTAFCYCYSIILAALMLDNYILP